MNKIYNIVWSHALQTWVVVSELTRAHKKKSKVKNLAIALVTGLGVIGSVEGATYSPTYGEVFPINTNSGGPATGGVAIGTGSSAQGDSVSYGVNAKALNRWGVSIGLNAQSGSDVGSAPEKSSDGTVAIGVNSKAAFVSTVAIGAHAEALSNYATAVGTKAIAKGTNSIAIGEGATTSKDYGLALGKNAATTDNFTSAIGYKAEAKSLLSSAMGSNAKASGESSIAIGGASLTGVSGNVAPSDMDGAKASGNSSSAVGASAQAIANQASAYGNKTTASGVQSTALGDQAKATNVRATATGAEADASGSWATATGTVAVASGEASTAIGESTKASGSHTVAVGTHSEATGDDSFAAGNKAKAIGASSISIGKESKANSEQTIALGDHANATGSNSMALGGFNAVANGSNAAAIGSNSNASANDSIAFGNGSKATAVGGIALGTNSVASRAAITQNDVSLKDDPKNDNQVYAPVRLVNDLKSLDFLKATVRGNLGALSVGSESATRQITNVAAGSHDDDAVNVAQLKAVVSNIKHYDVKSGDGINVTPNDTQNPATTTWTISVDPNHIKSLSSWYLKADNDKTGRGENIQGDEEVTLEGSQGISTSRTGNKVTFKINKGTLTKNNDGSVTGTAGDVFTTTAETAAMFEANRIKYFSVNSTLAGNANNNGATATDAIAIGPNAVTDGARGITLGSGAKIERVAGANNDTSAGSNTSATNSATDSIAIGTNAYATASNSIVIGNGAQSLRADKSYQTGENTIAIGKNATASHTSGIAIGTNASAKFTYGVAIGHEAKSTGGALASTAVGGYADATGEASTALGTLAQSKGHSSSAVGREAVATGDGATSLGFKSNTSGPNGIAIGRQAQSILERSIALGNESKAQTTDAMALGTKSVADGVRSIAIGRSTVASAEGAIAIGSASNGNGENPATAAGKQSVAIGINANVQVDNGIALGRNTSVTVGSGVAIGEASEASKTGNQQGWDASHDFATGDSRTNVYADARGTGLAARGNLAGVSIGKDGKYTRQLNNLAAGTLDTDAVNVAQLKSVNLGFTGNQGKGDVRLHDQRVSIVGKENSFITTTASNGKVEIDTKFGSITNNSTGTSTKGTNGLATTDQVVDAVNNAGWNIIENTNNARGVVKSGDTVDFANGTGTTVSISGNSGTRTVKINAKVAGIKAGKNTKIETTDGVHTIHAADQVESVAKAAAKDGDANLANIEMMDNTTDRAANARYGVSVSRNAVKDAAREAVKVEPNNTNANNPITVTTTPNDSNHTTTYTLNFDGAKAAKEIPLTYKANGENAQTVKLNEGLNFINGDDTKATVEADGKVKIDLSDAAKAKLGKTYSAKGTGHAEVTTSAVNNNTEFTVTVTDKGVLSVNEANGKVNDVTQDGLVTAKKVQDAINKSGFVVTSDVEQNKGLRDGAAATNTVVHPGDKVTFIAGENLKIKQEKGQFTYSLNPTLTNLNSASFVKNNANTVTLDGDGLTIKNGNSDVKLTKEGLNNGNNKITHVAEGTKDTDAVNVSQLNKAITGAKDSDTRIKEGTYTVGNDGKVTMTYVNGKGETVTGKEAVIEGIAKNDLSNITDAGKTVINTEAKKAVKVIKGHNTTVTEGTDGDAKTYAVNVQGDLTKVSSITNEAGSGKVAFNSDGVVKVDGDKAISLDGKQGYITGLQNIEWNVANPTFVSGRAATEDQLKTVSDVAKSKIGDNTISLGGDTNTATSKQNLSKDGGIKFNVVGAKGADNKQYISTSATGDNVSVDLTQDTKNLINNAANKDLSNLSTDGKNVITNIAKENDRSIKQGTYNVDANGNVTMTYVDGNNKDITGTAVISGIAKQDLSNINSKGQNVITALGTKVVAGDNTVTVKEDKDATTGRMTYTITSKAVESVGLIAGDDNIATLEREGDDKAAGTRYNVGVSKAKIQEIAKGASAWKISVDSANATSVNGGETVDFKSGDNIDITQDGRNLTIATKKDLKSNTVTVGEKGDKGVDGKVTANGKDGSSVVINGKDGSIGLSGNDGANGLTIKGDKGVVGVDGTDGNNGKDGMTRITYTDKNDVKHTVATLDDGMKYAGDDAQGENKEKVVKKKLNETVDIIGGADSTKLTDSNIGVNNVNGKLKVQLAKNVDLGPDGSVKTGNTTINTNGITITPSVADATKVVSLTANGLNNGDNKITNVAKGEADTDAVNVKQLKDTVAAEKAVESVTKAAAKDGDENIAEVSVVSGKQDEANAKYGVSVSKAKVTEIAKKAVKVIKGHNTTVTEGTDGDAKTYAVNVQGDLTKVSSITNEAGSGKVAFNSDGVVKVDGDKAISLDGKQGYITGLQNKDWDVSNPTVVSGRAATEDQLKKVADTFNSNVKAAKTTVSVNNQDKDANKNLVLSETKNADGSTNYDVSLANKVTLGKDANRVVVDGEEGTITAGDGDTTVTVNGKKALIRVGNGEKRVSIDGKEGHVTNLQNRTWDVKNPVVVNGRAATEDQLKSVNDSLNTVLNNDIRLGGDSGTETGKQKLNQSGGIKFDVVGGYGITTIAEGNKVTLRISDELKNKIENSNHGGGHTNVTTTSVLKDGKNTKVTGSGSSSNPYKVNVEGDLKGITSIEGSNNAKITLGGKDDNGQPNNNINVNGGKITNVKAGERPTDAVNVSQLNKVAQVVNNNARNIALLDNKINNIDRNLRAGIAGAMAAGGLYQATQPGKSMVSAGVGTYKGQNAIAVGYSRLSDNGKIGIKFSVNGNSQGEKGAAASMGYQW